MLWPIFSNFVGLIVQKEIGFKPIFNGLIKFQQQNWLNRRLEVDAYDVSPLIAGLWGSV